MLKAWTPPSLGCIQQDVAGFFMERILKRQHVELKCGYFYYTFIRRCVIRDEVATFSLYYLFIFGYRVCGSRSGGIHMRCVHMDRKGDRHGLKWLSTRFGSLACHSMLGYYSWRSRHSFLAFLAGEPLRIRIHVDVCS